MTITKKAVIFVAFQSFLYLMGAFVTWDLLWVENISGFSIDERSALFLFWLVFSLSALSLLFLED